jgi:hypothetical protein
LLDVFSSEPATPIDGIARNWLRHSVSLKRSAKFGFNAAYAPEPGNTHDFFVIFAIHLHHRRANDS